MLHGFDTNGFSKAIKTKRIIELNIGLRDVAKKIKVSAATLSRLENERLPDWDSFFKVCHWLNVSPSYFFYIPIKSKKKA